MIHIPQGVDKSDVLHNMLRSSETMAILTGVKFVHFIAFQTPSNCIVRELQHDEDDVGGDAELALISGVPERQ